MTDDRRLIEDYLPIQAISAEASREKSVRKGHISTLHLWWARRPLVACRAAVYGALVPASRFVPENGPDNKKQSLGRANAAKFIERLCKYPGNPTVIAEAQRHILEAHAERLTQETGEKVTVEDIVEGRAPRPKVLDMFAGGGAIPLEALRLGCEAYALDLNPVAHIIELCTLVYPQKYGKPDSTARGMAGAKNAKGETTWGGLAEEVRYWGNWVLKQVKAEIGDLYPLIPDPEFKCEKTAVQGDWLKEHGTDDLPPGYLMPVAYLWTRTVTCKNPHCRATVPLVKLTWLCKKPGRCVALRIVAPKGKKQVRFAVVEAGSENALGFDPAAGSKGGNAICPFCGTVADSDYVKAEGCAGRMAAQLMATVCTRPGKQGKVYLAADDVSDAEPDDTAIQRRMKMLCEGSGLTLPNEPIVTDAKNSCWTSLYGLTRFEQLFSPRQQFTMLSFCHGVQRVIARLSKGGVSEPHRRAIAAAVSLMASRLSNFCATLCTWFYDGGRGVKHVFARQALPMVWDFAETNPLNDQAASWPVCLDVVASELEALVGTWTSGQDVRRGSATALPWPDASVDCVITDPPYYDNVPYASISDFFYVWLKRSAGVLFPEHFASEGTPKKPEVVADALRHGGDTEKAREAYETMMQKAFAEAGRTLKSGGHLVVVYAHKTTLGWATLVEALRRSRFVVTEAWPLDTENVSRLRAMDSAALASSIFLVARKRDGAPSGSYEEEVRSELEQIVRERVGTLWEMGISGADLVIACVGAGLRAFTRFARVEYANGEEVPAERFLSEVETVVLESILARLSKEVGGNGGRCSLGGVDPATRFYTLWRYTYGPAELDAGEAIVFANGTHVELDGPGGLTHGARALVEKKKAKYRLRDHKDRGNDAKLGLPTDGQPAALVDVLHRTLWLMENRPAELPGFLKEARANLEQMRLVAQALAGPALKGGELANISPSAEQLALAKLTANWKSVVEDAALSAQEKDDQRTGQQRML